MKIDIDLKITESAIKEFKRSISEWGSGSSMIRISVQDGGCSGFLYNLGFAETNEIDSGNDYVIEEFESVKLVIDKKSLMYLDGTTIDWFEDSSQKGFKFDNPNAKKTCCKKSCQ